MMASEATWCARCSTVIHCACLQEADEICPACHASYDRPEGHFVFSQQCPECSRPNDPPQARCHSCGAGTRWDSQADYDNFAAHMKDTSRVYFLRGMTELAGGGMCLMAIVARGQAPLPFPDSISISRCGLVSTRGHDSHSRRGCPLDAEQKNCEISMTLDPVVNTPTTSRNG
jgi:hypothetical protein